MPFGLKIIAGMAILALASPARAFHEGGVAHCSGCHVVHASRDGQPVTSGYTDLLIAESPSDVCLTCHAEGLGAVFGLNPLAPPPERGAGNFVFLLEDNLNDGADGASNPIGGHAAGHSIVAPSRGVGSDPEWLVSPGGGFPCGQLGCTSCHDPHGNENFRMLYGEGPVQGGLFDFYYPAPSAEGLDLGSLDQESPASHSAYRSGVSRWCSNCHEAYLTDNHDDGVGSSFGHDTDRPMSNEAHRYNAYNGDLDPTGGDQATAYLPEVPFETYSMTTISTEGPHPSDYFNCLTCHRAHASSAPRSGRWDFNVDTLGQDGLVSGSYPLPNPYGDPGQRQLCFKCHTNPPGFNSSQGDYHHGSTSFP